MNLYYNPLSHLFFKYDIFNCIMNIKYRVILIFKFTILLKTDGTLKTIFYNLLSNYRIYFIYVYTYRKLLSQ